MSSSRAPASACLAALLAASCAPPLMKLPSGGGTAAPDSADALMQATAPCRQVRTLSAEVAVNGTLHARKVRGRLLVGFSAPASVRIEAVAPAGAPLFIFVAMADDATVLLPREDRFLAHAPPATVLDAVAGVPFGPGDLRDIVSGCGVSNPSIAAGQQFGPNWRRVHVSDSRDLYLRRDTGAWRLVAMVRAGADPVRVEYADFERGLPRSVRLVESYTPGGPPSGYDLTLRLSQVDVNQPLDAAAFQVRIPRSAIPITIDELRRSGPLGSPSTHSE